MDGMWAHLTECWPCGSFTKGMEPPESWFTRSGGLFTNCVVDAAHSSWFIRSLLSLLNIEVFFIEMSSKHSLIGTLNFFWHNQSFNLCIFPFRKSTNWCQCSDKGAELSRFVVCVSFPCSLVILHCTSIWHACTAVTNSWTTWNSWNSWTTWRTILHHHFCTVFDIETVPNNASHF